MRALRRVGMFAVAAMGPAISAVVGAALPAAAQGSGGRPEVDLSLCRTLVPHHPAPDVAYRPGVDVHGRAVAPADLPGSAGAAPPMPIDIPVTLDLARRVGVTLPPVAGLPTGTTVAWLSLVGDQLYLNGQPIGGEAETRLYAYCRAR